MHPVLLYIAFRYDAVQRRHTRTSSTLGEGGSEELCRRVTIAVKGSPLKVLSASLTLSLYSLLAAALSKAIKGAIGAMVFGRKVNKITSRHVQVLYKYVSFTVPGKGRSERESR
jgi:hypothetical protein